MRTSFRPFIGFSSNKYISVLMSPKVPISQKSAQFFFMNLLSTISLSLVSDSENTYFFLIIRIICFLVKHNGVCSYRQIAGNIFRIHQCVRLSSYSSVSVGVSCFVDEIQKRSWKKKFQKESCSMWSKNAGTRFVRMLRQNVAKLFLRAFLWILHVIYSPN